MRWSDGVVVDCSVHESQERVFDPYCPSSGYAVHI